MRRQNKTKSALLTDLSKIFRENGYEGTTLSKMTQATGLERASLYHHFPRGKQEMAKEVILMNLQALQDQVLAHLQTNLEPKEKLSNMLAAIKQFYAQGNDRCFISIFSVSQINEEITMKLKIVVESWLDLLVTIFHNLNYTQPYEEAVLAICSIQGSLIISQVSSDPGKFIICLETLAKSWSITPSDPNTSIQI